METTNESGLKTTLISIAVVVGIAVAFLLWGLLVYWSVGVKWPPAWDYGSVEDIPGSSPYSTFRAKSRPVWSPQEQPVMPEEQHVKGRNTRSEATRRNGDPQ